MKFNAETLWLVLVIPVCWAVQGSRKPFVKQGGLQDFDKDSEEELGNQLRRDDFVENKEHIQEHIKHEAKIDLDNMSEEELEFHFFKIHDSNSDNKLDGIELLHAISHGLDEQIERVKKMDIPEDDMKKRLDRIKNRHISSVDLILKEDDLDNDGYINYFEFASLSRAAREVEKGGDILSKKQSEKSSKGSMRGKGKKRSSGAKQSKNKKYRGNGRIKEAKQSKSKRYGGKTGKRNKTMRTKGNRTKKGQHHDMKMNTRQNRRRNSKRRGPRMKH